MEAVLKNFKDLTRAIYEDRDLRPPANLKLILDGLNETVSSVGLKICQDAATSEKNNFCASLKTVNKRLKTIKSKMKRQQSIEVASIDSLRKNLKDLQNVAYRHDSTAGRGITATSLIKTTVACKFWTESFGEVIFPHSNEMRCVSQSVVLSGCRGRLGQVDISIRVFIRQKSVQSSRGEHPKRMHRYEAN